MLILCVLHEFGHGSELAATVKAHKKPVEPKGAGIGIADEGDSARSTDFLPQVSGFHQFDDSDTNNIIAHVRCTCVTYKEKKINV